MIYCTKCGTPNPEQSRFCRNCGNPLQMQTVQPPKPPQYTPKPSTGVSVALIVFMLLLLIVNIAAASDRSMDPDIDGVVLTVVYLLLSVAAFPILSFFKKQAKVASRNFHFAILLALFTVNTLLIPMWNGSLLLPYILLSVGLAVNTVIAWFRRPALASGRDSFLKKFHFVMAGIGGIMTLFSLLAFFNTHKWSNQDPTDSSYSRMTSSSFWAIALKANRFVSLAKMLRFVTIFTASVTIRSIFTVTSLTIPRNGNVIVLHFTTAVRKPVAGTTGTLPSAR